MASCLPSWAMSHPSTPSTPPTPTLPAQSTRPIPSASISSAPSVPSTPPEPPPAPTPQGSFSVAVLGDKADKVGKDDNFRGLTIFNNVVYFTKGSGSNGVNTVYFVDTTGTACPKGGGLPGAGAKL